MYLTLIAIMFAIYITVICPYSTSFGDSTDLVGKKQLFHETHPTMVYG